MSFEVGRYGVARETTAARWGRFALAAGLFVLAFALWHVGDALFAPKVCEMPSQHWNGPR